MNNYNILRNKIIYKIFTNYINQNKDLYNSVNLDSNSFDIIKLINYKDMYEKFYKDLGLKKYDTIILGNFFLDILSRLYI